MSTTEIGNEFRSHVLALLKTKYPDAATEKKASWKNADIVFSMMDFSKRVRVGVECKYYNRKLTTADFRKILIDYEAAFSTQAITTLLVISKFDIEAASRQLVNDTPRLRFMLATELEEWLIGLRPYIEGLCNTFTTADVSHYYIDSRAFGYDIPAFEVLLRWLKTDEHNGIAILGGYGLGKSSIAMRLASHQARNYLADPANERMPVLLRLGQVVHETELSALFGKEFTSENVAEGYCFKTLLHLNENGRLLIILDGFDEMKHAMTEFDFKSNFREFNKLRKPLAKVLLLGRPNAFTSESTSLLIKGINKMAGQEYPDTDFPAWHEMNLEFFDLSESKQFLYKYLEYEAKKRNPSPNYSIINSRVDEIMLDVHQDILQRPVQARIVGQLAASDNYSFRNINRFRLYDDFVERMIGRDQEKRARSLIPAESRREFLEALAWWAWTRTDTSQSYFRIDDVPRSIFEPLPSGEAVNFNAKKSEYLVSSLTEKKDAEVLYFAHRSFQEFLVASSITRRHAFDYEALVKTNNAVTDDVYSFLKESMEADYLLGLYELLSSRVNETIRLSLLSLMQTNTEITSTITGKNLTQVSHYDVAIIGMIYEGNEFSFDGRVDWLTNIIKFSPNLAADCAAYILLVMVKSDVSLIRHLFAAIFERILSGVDSNLNATHSVIVEAHRFGAVGALIRDTCSKVRNLKGRRIRISFDSAVNALNSHLSKHGIQFRLEKPFDPDNPTEYDTDAFEKLLSPGAQEQFQRLFAIRNGDFSLVTRSDRISRNRSLQNGGRAD